MTGPLPSLGPLRLRPVLVPKPWGGRRLGELGRDLPDDGQGYGESWEVADLPPAATSVAHPHSRVADGAHAGATLASLVDSVPGALLGRSAAVDGRFPLLVKLLDAREDLSVQVHPPAAWVAAHPEARLKTESWVVLAAEPDAHLYLGLRPGTTQTQLAEALGTSAIVGLLRRVPARPGDVFHVEAGTIHAVGAGVLVAEVQTPSDTTFRLYDWTQEYGRAPRDLHVQEGLACALLAWEDNLVPPPSPTGDGVLVDVPAYRLVRHRVPAGGAASLALAEDVPRVLLVFEGRVVGAGLEGGVDAAGVVLLPASHAAAVVADAGSVVLEMVPGIR